MIVIPMAGLSSRFKKAGYNKPKYMLRAHGCTIFKHSVASFEKYFDDESFLFIALEVFNTKQFIEQECREMGIENYKIVILDEPTQGQAETVYKGLRLANVDAKEPITIFNIDTFRPNFSYPEQFDIENVDGYLETFIGSGANWSNILPRDKKLQSVALTAEKQEISPYCCTGLYYWNKSEDYYRVFECYSKQSIAEIHSNEYYIAPMYNLLISEGKDIRFSLIKREDVIFCGVPAEYEEILKKKSA